ncbi:hypothetical protein H310_12808 [Aphanomyces invadans]|uniref:RING-type domain-containing protein n=1 Tax=Aphanomyces invadans TaxID=157072 RepID=A0A024TGC2_9STRA|nr:hypothetical protein H310_12808 [Aphanomyces invadans]ETV93210.1 hypothetical protein H310_12808 [Aphanomyces invadans]|eukprot:XP_008878232.1 hypothetical protein H310_12808 [Aphanomyces invadans]
MADEGVDVAVAPRRRMKPLLLYEEIVLGGAHTAKRFTCVDVCARFLACGATNGSVYIFARSQKKQGTNASSSVTFRLLKMISPPSATSDRHQDPITCLSFCPAQRYLVVGTSRGAVYAISLLDPARIGEKIEFSHPLHHGFSVSALLWDEPGARLFSGCCGGTVAQTTIRAGVTAIFGSSSTEFLLKEDTSVVQLDIHHSNTTGDMLLVSSQTRVLVLNLAAAEGGVVQVGSKLRQGNFGGCFFTDPEDKQVKVYSSRPGKRVWVADPLSGTVSSTLKFSMSVPPTPFFQGPNLPPGDDVSVKNLNLSTVSLFKYIHESMDFTPELPQLLSWSPNSSALFLIDPIAVELVEWHVDLGIIHDLKVLDASVFVVLHGDPCKIAIVRACAAIEFLELAVSNDLQKSIELAVKCNILDLSLLLNLQCKWVEHVKVHPEDEPKLSTETLAELEALIDAAATLVQEHTRPQELDIAPPHVVFKQRRDAVDTPPTSGDRDQALSLKINFLYEKPPLYESVQSATNQIINVATTRPKRHVAIADLAAQDKVVDEAWRAQNMPAPSDVTLKPPTLFGEVDLETHLSNATSQLVSMLPEKYFGRSASTSAATIPDEPAEFPEFDPPDVREPTQTNVHSVLKLAMAVSSSTDDLSLIVPESADVVDAPFDPMSGQEVVLEAIATELFVTELQFQSKRPLAQTLKLKGDDVGTHAAMLRMQRPPPRSTLPKRQHVKPAQAKRPRTVSETKQQLILRTVNKQIGVYPASHVEHKWRLGGTMQDSVDLQAVAAQSFASMEAEFEKLAAAATTQLHLWPTATLTRLGSCLVNGYLRQGTLDQVKSCLEAFVGSFDPTIDVALLQKRKQIDQIKKNQLRAVKHPPSGLDAADDDDDDNLPLTRSDWTFVRLLVSFYFLLLGPVHVEEIDGTASALLDRPLVILELDVQCRFVEHRRPPTTDEATVQAFLAKYGNYINLDWAAKVCSMLEFSHALTDVLNFAIASESLAIECEDVLNKVAENHSFDFPNPSALCVCLHLLHVLLKKRSDITVSWCIDMYPQVSPWNVQWAVFGASVGFDKANSTYLRYLTTLLQTHPRAATDNCALVTQWLHMHFAQGQDEAILVQFLRQQAVYNLPQDVVSTLCLEHGRWKCLLQLVLNSLAHPSTRAAGVLELRQMVYSMLQSEGHLSSLHSIFRDMMGLDAPETLVSCILEEVDAYMQDAATDGASDNKIYIGILHALFDACGPHVGLRLLEKCPTLLAVAPLELYQALVEMQALQNEHSELVTHMLEEIDTYIWSCSRSHHMGFAPQVEAMFRIECGYYNHLKQVDAPAAHVATKWSTSETAQFFESRRNDWGGEIQLQDWHCVHCDLPVVYFGADERNLDAVLLPCGHAFHDVCLPDRTCSLCLVESFRFG